MEAVLLLLGDYVYTFRDTSRSIYLFRSEWNVL